MISGQELPNPELLGLLHIFLYDLHAVQGVLLLHMKSFLNILKLNTP
jgi:hypothetical protein